jgi:acetyl-CoA acetyltransferase
MSNMMLAADAAMNAIKDCGIDPKNKIDGVFSTHSPTALAHYLGITPTCIDGTSIGGTSFLLHVRHAAAALTLGYCNYALVTMGESGHTRGDSIGLARGGGMMNMAAMMAFGGGNSLGGQFEAPYGTLGPTTLFGMGVLRYMKETGLTHEQLASVAVAQRKWSHEVPRAMYRDLITVEDVFNSRLICYPFHLLECCLVTDGGGAIILTTAERARDFPTKPVYIMGTGESVETAMVSQMEDMTRSQGFEVSQKALDERKSPSATTTMVYDASRTCRSTPWRPSASSSAARPARSSQKAAHLPAASCRSTPTAVASPTPTAACTACTCCRRLSARCAARRPTRCRTSRCRLSRAWAACSAPWAPPS